MKKPSTDKGHFQFFVLQGFGFVFIASELRFVFFVTMLACFGKVHSVSQEVSTL